jgi:hypothetical protein
MAVAPSILAVVSSMNLRGGGIALVDLMSTTAVASGSQAAASKRINWYINPDNGGQVRRLEVASAGMTNCRRKCVDSDSGAVASTACVFSAAVRPSDRCGTADDEGACRHVGSP